MSGPITWQNVNGPSLSEASRPLEAAQRSFQGSFDTIGALLKDRQAIDAQNYVQGKENNTNAFLNKLSELGKSPADLQEAMKSGAIDQLRAQFGNQIDQNKVRGAAESLLDSRYKQSQAADAFDVHTKITAQKPIEDDIRNTLYTGNIGLAKTLLKENSGLYNSDKLSAEIQAAERGEVEFGFKKDDQRLQVERQAADIENMKKQRELQQQGLSLQRQGLDIQRTNQTAMLDDRLDDKLGKLRSELGDIAGIRASSSQGTKAIYDQINNIKDDNLRGVLLKAAPAVIGTKDMTTGAALTALLSQTTASWFQTDAGDGRDILKTAQGLVASPDVTAQNANNAFREAQVVQRLQALTQKQQQRQGASSSSEKTRYRNQIIEANQDRERD